jgi:hypothetical protein
MVGPDHVVVDATCVCVSTVGGQCSNLAQSVVNLVPDVNSLFNVNLTTTSVATALWQVQALQQASNNCAEQADLIDVAPALDSATFPNRTKWAQAALLWNLALSENLTATQVLQEFVQNADWKTLGARDGPVTGSDSGFTTVVSGFQFDFASQKVDVPPATFADDGQPPSDQLNQVNDIAEGALDRMYSFALGT